VYYYKDAHGYIRDARDGKRLVDTVPKDERTTKQKVKDSFKELRTKGYFARMNYMCCSGCVWASIDEKVEKVVFYHKQDNDAYSGDWLKEGKILWIAWNGDPNEIIEVFEANKLIVIWNGSEDCRIGLVEPSYNMYNTVTYTKYVADKNAQLEHGEELVVSNF